MPRRNGWTRDQLLIALRLYMRLPFGRLYGTNPEIVTLAAKIGRTPGALAMKACNFASLDPNLAQMRFAHTGRGSLPQQHNLKTESSSFEVNHRPTTGQLMSPTFPRGRGDKEAVSVHSTTTTAGPRTFIRGVMPRPGCSDAASRPFVRCGAPSAIETVP